MSTLKTNTLSNAAGTKSVPVDTVIDGSAKAWVNFNGTGTVAIRAAFNVTSITDNGVGDYTVNFTTALVDANYSAVATSSTDGTTIRTAQTWTAATTTTTSCKIYVATTNTTSASDATIVTASFFR